MTDEPSAEELERERRRRITDESYALLERLKQQDEAKRELEREPPAEVARRLIPRPACDDDAVARWAGGGSPATSLSRLKKDA
jgi:hypothetical protein